MKEFAIQSRLCDPGHVVRLVLERDAEKLMLTLAVRLEHGTETKELRFFGVSELRFRGDTIALQEIVLLLAEDVSSRGWEGVRFSVNDYENEFISFLCAKVEQLS